MKLTKIHGNSWKFKSPYIWKRMDTFCWLLDWFVKNKIILKEFQIALKLIDSGTNLYDQNIQYFLCIAPKYGLDLFEDLHIHISSFILENSPIVDSHYIKNVKPSKISPLFLFLHVILNNDLTNPATIEWLDFRKTIFKITNKSLVVSMYAMIKNNKHMTYDKMTRVFRTYYATGRLEPYYDKYCYKFGKNFLE